MSDDKTPDHQAPDEKSKSEKKDSFKPISKQFVCPKCSGSVKVYAVGQTVSAACKSCSSIIDVSTPELKILQHQKDMIKTVDPDLELGAIGKLKGTDWVVIGTILQTDSTEMWNWREYLLFNDRRGFMWIVENQGHWTLFKKTKYKPKVNDKKAVIYGKDYRLFTKDSSKVVAVIGEFYWRVKVGEKAETADYINPPEMLSKSKSDGDIVWTLGEYIPREEVQEAFGLKSLPPARGVAPNQPYSYDTFKGMVKQFLVLLAVLLLGQFIYSCAGSKKLIYSHTFNKDDVQNVQKQLVSDVFEVKGLTTALELEAKAPVMNDWVNLGVTFTNVDSNSSFNFNQEISFFYGTDSDGRWSEGGQTSDRILSSVAPGRYLMTMEPSNLEKISPPEVTVSIYQNAFFMSNFWLGVIYILIAPMWTIYRSYNFEVQRWEDSDYSPYSSD